MCTQGIHALDPSVITKLGDHIRSFDGFDEDNDPYGEHDFGSVDVCGYQVFFKIEYFNPALTAGSDDPSNPTVTKRVMTIMLAEEY